MSPGNRTRRRTTAAREERRTTPRRRERGRTAIVVVSALLLAAGAAALLLRTRDDSGLASGAPRIDAGPPRPGPAVAPSDGGEAAAAAVRREAFRGDAAGVEPNPRLLLEAAYDAFVTETNGAPAVDAPVVLVDPSSARPYGAIVRTDAAGKARVLSSPTLAPHGARPELAFPYAAEAPPAAETPGVTRLVRPPTGALRVSVLGPDGAPPPYGCEIEIKHAAPPEARSDLLRGADLAASAGPDGLATATLGRGLRLQVIARSRVRGEGRVVCDGPGVDGSPAEVVVRLSDAPAVLRARLLLPGGAPHANAHVRLHRPFAPETPRSLRHLLNVEATTDADGRATFEVERSRFEIEACRVALRTIGPVGTRLVGEAALVADGAGGFDAGDVALAADAPLVAGRVVDEDGRAARDATVRAWCPPPRIDPATGSADVQYAELHRRSLAVVCDAQTGAFAVYGPAGPWPLTIQAAARGYAREGRAVAAPGTVDVVVQVSGATGELEGTVALGSFPPTEFGVAFFVAGEPFRGPVAEVAVAEDATFRSGPLRAGTYDVALRFGRPRTEAALGPFVRDVVVEAGRVASDPRLRPLSAGAGLRRVRLTVVDEAGRPVVGAAATPLAGTAATSEVSSFGRAHGTADAQGVLALYLADGAADVRVFDADPLNPTLQSVVLRGVLEDRRVVLPARPALRIVTTNADLDRPGASLRPYLLGEGGDTHPSPFGDLETLRPPAPGEYEVQWSLAVSTAHGGTIESLPRATTPQRVRVTDAPGEQRCVLSPPPDVLAAARKRLVDIPR